MARLFITSREIDLINDWNKEIIKDVIGQVVYLFPISEIKTKIHDIYEESPEKIFENPIKLDAIVEWMPEEVATNEFGTEEFAKISVYIHARDMLDKGIMISEGDFFSYGDRFFEITSNRTTHNIYGQIEYTGGVKLEGRISRKSNFLSKVFGPTSEWNSDEDAIQKQFVQQRGYAETIEGDTGDVRSLRAKGILEEPITGPSIVSPQGDVTGGKSSFYDEQD